MHNLCPFCPPAIFTVRGSAFGGGFQMMGRGNSCAARTLLRPPAAVRPTPCHSSHHIRAGPLQRQQRRSLSLLGPTNKEEAVTWKIYGGYVAAAAAAGSGAWQLYRWATQESGLSGVTHTVLLRLKPDASPAEIAAVSDAARKLPSKIPQIRTYSVGQQIAAVDDGRNAMLGLVATFASESDYQIYAGHPDHKAFIVGSIVPCLAPGGRAALQIAGASSATTPGSVTHAVLLKLKADASTAQIAAIVEGLRSLPAKIPAIKSYNVGQQIAAVDDGRNMTLGLVATFASEADYQIYAGHPDHKAVIVDKIVPCLAPGGRVALQFQA